MLSFDPISSAMTSETQELRPVDQNAAPLRIPKLTYRNRIPESAIDEPNHYDSPHNVLRRSPQHEQSQNSTTAHVAANVTCVQKQVGATAGEIAPCDSPATPYHDMRRSSASAATGMGSTGPTDPQVNRDETKRKKHSSLLGFFSLKEPSTSALEDFARQQQKQAAAKGGRMTAVGMPGTSSQKLPSTVPKVNSKWDGLPSPIRDKARDIRSTTRDSSYTVTSRTSSSSSSSKTSSLNSGSSVRFASPIIQASISEVPEPSTELTSARLHEAVPQFRHDASSEPLEAKLFSNVRKQRSDSVADSVASSSSATSRNPRRSLSLDPKAGNPRPSILKPLDGQGTSHGPADVQSARPRSVDNQSSRERADIARRGPHAPTPTIQGVRPSTGHTEASKPMAMVSSREQKRPHTAKAEVLPWETQAQPPSPPSNSTAAPPKEEERKKNKLGFLSRRHK